MYLALRALDLNYFSDLKSTEPDLLLNESGIPACLVGLQAHTQGGKSKGLACGGVSRPTPKGKLKGLAWRGGLSRPTPRGEVEGSGLGGSRPTPRGGEVQGSGLEASLQAHTQGLQAHTQGPGGKLRGLVWGVSRPTPRGSPGPHLGEG